MIIFHLWHVLAQNFDAHLSGWVRLKDGAKVWQFFDPKLEKWGSSWEGRKMLGKKRKLKVLRMSSPIVEIVSGAATYVLHTPRGPQRPYSEKSENPNFSKQTKSKNIWPCLFSYLAAYFPLKGEPWSKEDKRDMIFKLRLGPVGQVGGGDNGEQRTQVIKLLMEAYVVSKTVFSWIEIV